MKLALVLFAVLGLLLFGCVGQPAPAPTAEPVVKYVCANGQPVSDPASCPVTTSPTPRVLSAEEQLSVCTGMPELQGTSMEDICLMGLAAKNDDLSLCQEVGRDTRYRCYAVIAIEKENAAVCSQAGSYANQCFVEYVQATRDSTACAKIAEISSRDSCYNGAFNNLNDPSLCEKITSAGQKDDCYFNAAMRTRDTVYCNKMASADRKQQCLNNFGSGNSEKPMPAQPV